MQADYRPHTVFHISGNTDSDFNFIIYQIEIDHTFKCCMVVATDSYSGKWPIQSFADSVFLNQVHTSHKPAS